MLRSLRVHAAVRSFHCQQLRPDLEGRVPSGSIFVPLLKKPSIASSHPLDDEKSYRRFLKTDLFEECCKAAPDTLGYKKRLHKMLDFNVPSFLLCWTFGPELFYRLCAPKEHQTPQNLRKSRLLRACIDLTFAYTTIFDDIADGSSQRCGRSAWKNACPEGFESALYDGMNLYNLPYFLIMKHFKTEPGYVGILETLLKADINEVMGSHLDLISQQKTGRMAIDTAKMINSLKAGTFFAMQPKLGVYYAGITDDEIIMQVEKVGIEMGLMVQCWDDFVDYFCTPEQTGKPPCDFINAGTTWASAVALKNFTKEQKQLFDECYGSDDPEKMESVRRLYDLVDIPGQYIAYMKRHTQKCANIIEDIRHPGVKNACQSWLNWLTGDVLKH